VDVNIYYESLWPLDRDERETDTRTEEKMQWEENPRESRSVNENEITTYRWNMSIYLSLNKSLHYVPQEATLNEICEQKIM